MLRGVNMNTKIYFQNGKNISSTFDNELFFLSIQRKNGRFWDEAKIIFYKNNYRNCYSVYGIECKIQYNDFEIGKIPMYVLDDYKEFKLYEVIFNEELNPKFKTVIKKAIKLIEDENKDLPFNTLSKYIRERIEERNNEILNLLNDFLKETEENKNEI